MPYCPRCNRLVAHGETFDGKPVTLDPHAKVYKTYENGIDGLLVERFTTAMVEHVATCPGRRFESNRSEAREAV